MADNFIASSPLSASQQPMIPPTWTPLRSLWMSPRGCLDEHVRKKTIARES
jgi:hypothetical protein